MKTKLLKFIITVFLFFVITHIPFNVNIDNINIEAVEEGKDFYYVLLENNNFNSANYVNISYYNDSAFIDIKASLFPSLFGYNDALGNRQYNVKKKNINQIYITSGNEKKLIYQKPMS